MMSKLMKDRFYTGLMTKSTRKMTFTWLDSRTMKSLPGFEENITRNDYDAGWSLEKFINAASDGGVKDGYIFVYTIEDA